MSSTIRRAVTVAGTAGSALFLLSGTALAHECFNPNKQPLAGAQIVFSDSGVTMTNGLEKRIDKGLIDLETGEGFHGLVGFEEDGFAGTTYIVGREGEIPYAAQDAGADCNGIVNIEDYFEDCTAP